MRVSVFLRHKFGYTNLELVKSTLTNYYDGEVLQGGLCPRGILSGGIMSMVLGRVFGVGGSNGAIFGSIKSKMAADGHLECFYGRTVTTLEYCKNAGMQQYCSDVVG